MESIGALPDVHSPAGAINAHSKPDTPELTNGDIGDSDEDFTLDLHVSDHSEDDFSEKLDENGESAQKTESQISSSNESKKDDVPDNSKKVDAACNEVLSDTTDVCSQESTSKSESTDNESTAQCSQKSDAQSSDKTLTSENAETNEKTDGGSGDDANELLSVMSETDAVVEAEDEAEDADADPDYVPDDDDDSGSDVKSTSQNGDDLDIDVVNNDDVTMEIDDYMRIQGNVSTKETTNDGTTMLENILKHKEPAKASKRALESPPSSSSAEVSKRLRLSPDTELSPDIQVPTNPSKSKKSNKFNSLKQFMRDRKLSNMTRSQLEELCIQKLCETIAQRSEIGDLLLKVKTLELSLKEVEKESANLRKQSKDLSVVHQRVLADLQKVREGIDRPLIIPKITRSVGLQAVARDENFRKRVQQAFASGSSNVVMNGANSSPTPVKSTAIRVISAPVANKSNSPIVNNNGAVVKSPPQQRILFQTVKTSSVQTISPTTKTSSPTITSNGRTKSVAISPKGSAAPVNRTQTSNGASSSAGVIDLTAEDDKRTHLRIINNAVQLANGKKVSIQAAPRQKLVLMPSNPQVAQVLMKLASTGNVVTSQPVFRTVQTNGTVPALTQARTAPVVSRAPIRPPSTAVVRKLVPVNNNSFRPRAPPPLKRHPAPLPAPPPPLRGETNRSSKPIPPKPILTLNKTSCGTGIILSWKIAYDLAAYEEIASYQLYAYQETKSAPRTETWSKIGDVKALDLPMAVTLTQFSPGNRYYFAVRAVDVCTRHGSFSDYQSISL